MKSHTWEDEEPGSVCVTPLGGSVASPASWRTLGLEELSRTAKLERRGERPLKMIG
jgi:hypothetical protein